MIEGLSIAVMAHEKRADRMDYLIDHLGVIPIFMDKGKIGDEGNLGPWGNAKRAWRACDPDAVFHMVVQDDVIFGKHFFARIKSLLEKYGNYYAYCLFANGNGRTKDEAFLNGIKKPLNTVIHQELYSGLAVILPTHHIGPMIEFGDKCTYDRGRGTWLDDDARISEYLKHTGVKVVYLIPSLVQHNKKLDSLIGYGHNRARQAKFFI